MADTTADELAIRNLIAHLAHAADCAPLAEIDKEYLDCFTDDAHWEALPAATAHGTFIQIRKGREDIRAGVIERRAKGWQGPGTNTLHLVTSIEVEVSGEQAVGRSCFMLLGDLRTAPRIRNAGHYHDRFVRTAGGWRLARRVMSQP